MFNVRSEVRRQKISPSAARFEPDSRKCRNPLLSSRRFLPALNRKSVDL